MAGTAERTDPDLWDKIKAEVTRGSKGGEAGQWSARKAQLAVGEYKKRGGRYKGAKSADNHLSQWMREDWGTRSGQPSGKTHERYLPNKARETLSDKDYDRSTAKKRADTAKGRQFSRQPADVAAKVKPTRDGGKGTATHDAGGSKQALMAEARKRNIPGRSRMSKDELAKALHA